MVCVTAKFKFLRLWRFFGSLERSSYCTKLHAILIHMPTILYYLITQGNRASKVTAEITDGIQWTYFLELFVRNTFNFSKLSHNIVDVFRKLSGFCPTLQQATWARYKLSLMPGSFQWLYTISRRYDSNQRSNCGDTFCLCRLQQLQKKQNFVSVEDINFYQYIITSKFWCLD